MKSIRSSLLIVALLLLVAFKPVKANAAELENVKFTFTPLDCVVEPKFTYVPLDIPEPEVKSTENVNQEEEIKSEKSNMLKFAPPYTTTHISKEKKPVESVTYNLDPVYNILSEEYVSPNWDYRKRIQDINILTELLVNQLGVSKTKAAAIIGNVVFEDSFISRTSSAAHCKNIIEARERIGRGTRGFGIVQWTSKTRQNTLLSYLECASRDLPWETASIIAETTFLYNELKYSNILGDLSEEGDIENCTGIIGYEYEGYSAKSSEWRKEGNHYKSVNCPRYSYACDIYNYMMKY